MPKETVLLTDGDIVAYRMAAAIEKRSIVVTHKASKRTKEFENVTALKTFLKQSGKEFVKDAYDIVTVQEPDDAFKCFYTIKKHINKFESFSFCDRQEIYLSGKDNFREKLLLPTQYKSNRQDSIRPVHLEAAKDYLVNKFDASKVRRIEADDVLSIRAYEEYHKGNVAIIASNDKDTLQAENIWFYDWTQKEPSLFEIPEIGYLEQKGIDVKGCGLKFFAFQLLNGDPVDGYKPSQLSGTRFGKKSALSILDDLYEPSEILGAVVQQYKEWYPEPFTYEAWNGHTVDSSWDHMLDLYFKAAYMKRAWNDESNWRLFFEMKGVKL